MAVSYHLYGGSRLGNVLHQIAATYAYARKHNLNYIIPRDLFGYHKILTKVNYGEIHPEVFTKYSEPSHAYNEIPSPAKLGSDNILLDGYFQCFKYCEDYRSEILDLFGFTNKINKGVVSIHVRRGDYVKYQVNFPLCTMVYYNKAIEAMKASGYTEFMVFSDDIPWCKENFSQIKGVNIRYSQGTSIWHDLYAQSECEHNIISNSTYSVWAAWANSNPNKIVIAPDKLNNWYGKKQNINTKDVYPDDWIGIKF